MFLASIPGCYGKYYSQQLLLTPILMPKPFFGAINHKCVQASEIVKLLTINHINTLGKWRTDMKIGETKENEWSINSNSPESSFGTIWKEKSPPKSPF